MKMLILLTFRISIDRLVPYVKGMGFTHVELMPVSWNTHTMEVGVIKVHWYFLRQLVGSEHLEDFMALIDAFHKEGIAV
jgi:1,4-alpha-glucan branching enzyme